MEKSRSIWFPIHNFYPLRDKNKGVVPRNSIDSQQPMRPQPWELRQPHSRVPPRKGRWCRLRPEREMSQKCCKRFPGAYQCYSSGQPPPPCCRCRQNKGVCPESGKIPKFDQNLNDFQQAKKFRRFAAKSRQNKGGFVPKGGFPWNSIDNLKPWFRPSGRL